MATDRPIVHAQLKKRDLTATWNREKRTHIASNTAPTEDAAPKTGKTKGLGEMKQTTPLIAAALMLSAAPALAGNTSAAPVEQPVVSQAAPVQSFSSPDWTGFYGGVQLGYADIDTSVSGSNDGFIGGLIAGYDFDLGNWVVGGGLDYDFADISIANGAADVENVFRAKVRGGYKIGDGLLYATGGYAQADTDNLGSDDGYFIGGGYEHRITQNFSLGGELLYHEFDNYNGTTVDVEATTVQLRGTFRF